MKRTIGFAGPTKSKSGRKVALHSVKMPARPADTGQFVAAERVKGPTGKSMALSRAKSRVAERARPGQAPVEIVATHPPVHPGAILREEFMEPMGLTAYAIAKACHVPRSKIERIAREDLGISGDTAVRLGRFFGTSDQFWMNLQATYEVLRARQEIGDAVSEIEPVGRT